MLLKFNKFITPIYVEFFNTSKFLPHRKNLSFNSTSERQQNDTNNSMHGKNESGETITMNCYNALPWEAKHNSIMLINSTAVEIPLVSLHEPHGSYEPCDSNTYTQRLEIRQLERNTSNTLNSTMNIDQWVGVLDYYKLKERCGVVPLMLFYTNYAALTAQNLGALGLIYGMDVVAKTMEVQVPPNVDIGKHTVNGVEVVIPVVAVDMFVHNMSVFETPSKYNLLLRAEITPTASVALLMMNETKNGKSQQQIPLQALRCELRHLRCELSTQCLCVTL